MQSEIDFRETGRAHSVYGLADRGSPSKDIPGQEVLPAIGQTVNEAE